MTGKACLTILHLVYIYLISITLSLQDRTSFAKCSLNRTQGTATFIIPPQARVLLALQNIPLVNFMKIAKKKGRKIMVLYKTTIHSQKVTYLDI